MSAPVTCVIVCPHCLTRLDVHAPPVQTIREMIAGGMLVAGSVFPHKRMCHDCDGAAFLFWREQGGSVVLEAVGIPDDDEIAVTHPIAFACSECPEVGPISLDQGAPFCKCGAPLVRPPVSIGDATPDTQGDAPRDAVGDRVAVTCATTPTPERD